MIVFLAILISLVIGITFIIHEYAYWGFDIGDIVIGILFAVVSFIVMIGITLLISLFPSTELVKVQTNSITALKDNSKHNGSFFLGSGNVGDDQYYFYIKETSKGKKMNKVNTDDSYIKEESVNPYVVRYEHHYKSGFAKILFGERNLLKSDEYIFHVPKGTITTDFNVDMEN